MIDELYKSKLKSFKLSSLIIDFLLF